MKILRRHLEKDGCGFVKLVCEEDEDMWHIYNLVRIGDIVKCSTFRKVTTESATGSKSSQRVQMTLAIVVEAIHFDLTVCTLHLKGRNVQEVWKFKYTYSQSFINSLLHIRMNVYGWEPITH